MKKWFYILLLFLLPGFTAFSQNDSTFQEGGKIAERMKEYVQKNLGLSKIEAEKFSPVFMRYYREFVQTHRQNREDILLLKQKIIELRIRYRTEFRQIMDEKRANKVFQYEDKFRLETKRIINESRRDRIPPRRVRALLLR